MAVRVAKIDAAAAVPVIEVTVVEAPRCAAIGELRLPDAAEDGIELGIADVEGVMVALELLVVIEKERETYWRKMPVFRIGMKAKNPREKLGRCHLIAGRDDGMVEGDGHRLSDRIPAVSRETLYKAQTFITGAASSL